MKIIDDLQGWRDLRKTLSGRIGFVPTMGALHDGHASLLRRSVAEQDLTVLSIYVNPTQFNDPKDLASYPDTLADDLALATDLGVDIVILPRYSDIYADGFRYQINETEFSDDLCGANRPGHFTGVLTVVMKLLNLVRPDAAYFGQKDFQQYLLVRDMCAAFFMDIDIVGCATVREADGLAMSSRNKLLNARARCQAGHFAKLLRSSANDQHLRCRLEKLGFEVDYIETRDDRRFAAVVIASGDKSVRLIDNVELDQAV